MKVLILTEGGSKRGLGHIARCVALYQAFKELGVKPHLFIKSDTKIINKIFRGVDFEIFDWLNCNKRLKKYLDYSDIVVIDSYLSGLDFYKRVSEITPVPVYLDDNKRINYPRGIVWNGNIHARNLHYPKNMDIKYFLGTKYALLRKEFWDAPEKILNRKLETIALTFGGSDTAKFAKKVLKLLIYRYPEAKKKIIIGMNSIGAREIDKLKDKMTELIYSPDSKMMKTIMLESDAAICAAGQTLYEFARIGVPVVVVVIIGNQFKNMCGWKRSGYLLSAGNINDKNVLKKIEEALGNLTYEKRKGMSRIGKRYIDGGGAKRFVRELLKIGKKRV